MCYIHINQRIPAGEHSVSPDYQDHRCVRACVSSQVTALTLAEHSSSSSSSSHQSQPEIQDRRTTHGSGGLMHRAYSSCRIANGALAVTVATQYTEYSICDRSRTTCSLPSIPPRPWLRWHVIPPRFQVSRRHQTCRTWSLVRSGPSQLTGGHFIR